LRAAPGDAREKWARDLAAMPDGPRRRAAISGFYKLLVQFDPEAAAKAIDAIKDEKSLRLALGPRSMPYLALRCRQWRNWLLACRIGQPESAIMLRTSCRNGTNRSGCRHSIHLKIKGYF